MRSFLLEECSYMVRSVDERSSLVIDTSHVSLVPSASRQVEKGRELFHIF